MTAVMLATCPELFAAGAVIAGLPYGSARSMPEAFDRMRGHGLPSGPVATAAVLTASGHAGPWPSLSVFHGTADHTVSATNADACVAQWLGVHDLSNETGVRDRLGPHVRRRWADHRGEVLVEDYRLQGMGHGVPLDLAAADACGEAGPFMLDVGLSSTQILAERWGLTADVAASGRDPLRSPASEVAGPRAGTGAAPQMSSIQATIEQALRQAGLMR